MSIQKLLLVICIGLHHIFFPYIVLGVQGQINRAVFKKIECTDVDLEFFAKNTTCRIKAVKRNIYHLNMRFFIVKPADNIVIQLKLFKKFNTFQPFLINIEENYCDFLAKKHVSTLMKTLGDIYFPYSNVNTSCPLLGEQIFQDMPLNLDKIPSLWPPGEYRLDTKFVRFNKLLLTVRFGFFVQENSPGLIGR